MENKNNEPSDIVFLVQFCLVAVFLLFAAGFVIYQIGWSGVASFATFGALFLPLLIAPRIKSSRRKDGNDNYSLDPIYKGWLGNVFTKK